MIFVRAERSKKDEARKVLQEIYDGSSKAYTRGEMFLFIPVKSRLQEDYTPSQRDKFIFNHNRYLGTEDCMAIFGLKDVNTGNIKNRDKNNTSNVTQSIPGLQGMLKPRLFQTVDPNSSHMCTLITFQQCDRPYIEQQKHTLLTKIEAIIGKDQIPIIVHDIEKGIYFSGAHHKKKGKIIRVHDHSPEHQTFLQHANGLLASPPKKRLYNDGAQQTPKFSMASTMTYKGMVQQNTTCTQSTTSTPQKVTTTTTTSQTVMSVIETQFQTIVTAKD